MPPDSRSVASDVGVTLYQKDYAKGNPDFVQVVSLGQGASVRLLHGPIGGSPGEHPAYAGESPRMRRQSLQEAWDALLRDDERAFSITNGQFFSTKGQVFTELSFPLKVGGEIVSVGGGSGYLGQRLMLELWSDRAGIRPLTAQALKESSAPNIIAGLSQDVDKGIMDYTGRTFVGVADADGDGRFEIVLIFNSRKATQPGAAKVLASFGARQVMMLDGGGSTRLICRGTPYVVSADQRTVPQTLAVLAGTAAPPDGGGGIGEWLDDWCKSVKAGVEKRIDEAIEGMKQQFAVWVQTELERMAESVCATVFVPGAVAAVWWMKRRC